MRTPILTAALGAMLLGGQAVGQTSERARPQERRAAVHPAARPAPRPAPKPALVVPPVPPPPPVVPPPLEVPVRPVPPPSPVPILPTAPGVATPIPGGQRITFGKDGSDLNPSTDAAIRATVHTAPPGPNTTFTVSAFAAGTPEDPSTSRRLSLARALAVRSVLIAEGIPSVRIYVKALGTTTPAFAEGPSERVDIVVSAPEAPPAGPVPMPTPTVPMPTPSPPAPAPKPAPAAPAGRVRR